MSTAKFAAAASLCLLSASPALAAQTSSCDPLAGLIRQARSDFKSLTMRKFESGTCTVRGLEYRCSWSFPSDAFAIAEAQSERVQHCALAQPGVEAVASKKGETGFALEDDLTLFVSAPEPDMGDWQVRIRVVENGPVE